MSVRQNSFTHFIYPFQFDAESFADRVHAVESAHWQRTQGPTHVWQTARLPKEDMLAYVADNVNPRDGVSAIGRFWKLSDAWHIAISSADWQLETPRGKIPFQLAGGKKSSHSAALALFHNGVGLLTVRAQPRTGQLAEWLNFQHSFRFLGGRREVFARAEATGEAHAFLQNSRRKQELDTSGDKDAHVSFDDVLESLLGSAAIEGETISWWREVFIPGRLLPFAAFFVDGVPEQEQPQVLYRARRLFYFDQKGVRPSPSDLSTDNPSLLPYSAKQWFVVGREGACFVAFDAPDVEFTRSELPAHLAGIYLFCYLFALHQRFGLLKLIEALTKSRLPANQADPEPQESMAKILESFLAFSACSYFSEIAQSDNHHRYFQACRRALQVEQLYEELGEKLRHTQP